MLLLDFIRYHRGETGTKIGCREGDCGACTVLIGSLVNGELKYESMTSCLLPLGNLSGKQVVTIEGINLPGQLNPIQQAMADEGATQCGFCTPGFVMSLAGYCLNNGGENVVAAIDGNICRCTGYKSIERAAANVAELMKNNKDRDAIPYLTANTILPGYFSSIKKRLEAIHTDPSAEYGLPTTHSQLSTILAGGTDLYVQRHEELVHSEIRFLSGDTSHKEIRRENDQIILGHSVTVTDLLHSEIIRETFPSFPRYAKLVSSTPIRNMATVAGNFVNASPIGDFTIFFLALDARLLLTDGREKRELPLRDFYKGYKSLDKNPGEIIESIRFGLPGKNSLFHFEKVSKRTHLDIASVNSAILLERDGGVITSAGLSAGGVGPVPMYLRKTSEFLAGKKISVQLVHDTVGMMHTEISPISDARGTKEYKKLLLGQLIKAHFLELFPELEAARIITLSVHG